MIIENGVLVINDQRIVLPEIKSDTVVKAWSVPETYRENGIFIAVPVPGKPVEFPACSAIEIVYLGEVEYLAPEANKLVAAKAAKLVQINESCERALAALTSTYPPGELQSWPQQVQEAAALLLDPKAATPLLSAIAKPRGLKASDLAGRVQEKAVVYGEASGSIIGKRQAAEDRIGEAETLEQVAGITW